MREVHEDLLVLEEGLSPDIIVACCTANVAKIK